MMSSQFASSNVKTNSYITGIKSGPTTTTKPTVLFLYSLTRSTAESTNSLRDDRVTGTLTYNSRFGKYAFSKVILFTAQLSNTTFQNITNYLLTKYTI